jgi:ribosome assembly protein 1
MLYPKLREETLPPKNKLEADLYASKSDPESYVVAYVSKMFAVPAKELPENKNRPSSAGTRGREARIARLQGDTGSSPTPLSSPSPVPLTNDGEAAVAGDRTPGDDAGTSESEVILGFARLYSGTISVGAEIYAVLPKYNAALGPKHRVNKRFLHEAQVEGLYVMMGRELVGVKEVKAGNLFAIKGLDGKVWRSATLCSPGEGGIEGDSSEWLANLGGVNRVVSPFGFNSIDTDAIA